MAGTTKYEALAYFKKLEGTEQMRILALLSGENREVEIVDELLDSKVKSRHITGDTRVLLKGEFKREQDQLMATFNRVIARLKNQFSHLEAHR